ncbi:hypothetical protein HS7_17840 [Sulfolobales archaeon HS-7]|nr:hypothetical protein HS7_17840 [Sulfolobales archaeon HS-7]
MNGLQVTTVEENNLMIIDTIIPTKKKISGLIAYFNFDLEVDEIRIIKAIVCNTQMATYICNLVVKTRDVNSENLKDYLKTLSKVDFDKILMDMYPEVEIRADDKLFSERTFF